MSRRPNRKDPQVEGESNNARSCTPERTAEMPTEAHTSSGLFRTQQHSSSPCDPVEGSGSSPQGALANPRQLMSRLKSVVNEMVQSVQNPVNLVFLDDYIAIADEGLKALRTAKVDACT